MNLTPQVETAEISDIDLDNVSGGTSAAAGNVALVLDTPVVDAYVGVDVAVCAAVDVNVYAAAAAH